MKLFISGQ